MREKERRIEAQSMFTEWELRMFLFEAYHYSLTGNRTRYIQLKSIASKQAKWQWFTVRICSILGGEFLACSPWSCADQKSMDPSTLRHFNEVNRISKAGCREHHSIQRHRKSSLHGPNVSEEKKNWTVSSQPLLPLKTETQDFRRTPVQVRRRGALDALKRRCGSPVGRGRVGLT